MWLDICVSCFFVPFFHRWAVLWPRFCCSVHQYLPNGFGGRWERQAASSANCHRTCIGFAI